MKTNFLKSAVMAFALGASANSFAGLIVDTVTQNQYVRFFGAHSYEHNINDNGFVLGSALSASLSINVRDDRDFFREPEVVLFQVERFDFDSGGFNFGTAFLRDLQVNALGALNADGKLNVTIRSVFGDFIVGDSVLSVTTRDVVETAEPGTLALLGLGLAGLGFSRRRNQNA